MKKLEDNKIHYTKRVFKEENRIDEVETNIQKMERMEMELLNRLKNS